MSLSSGLLFRLIGRWNARKVSETPDAEPEIDPRLLSCADKVCDAATAVANIGHGERVFVGSACATPRSLVAALEAMQPPPADIELLHFLTDHVVQHDAAGQPLTQFRHRSFFVGQDMQAAVRQGFADYVPISLARVPQLMAIGRIPVDVALIQVSMPDEFGYVSLGVSVDVIPAAVARARLVIAEVNPQMPRTMGDSMLHVGEIDHLVPVDTPVIEHLQNNQPALVVETIARYIGSIIDDGSTLQIGMGHFSNEVLKHLTDRTDLGIHSDVITDAIIPLLERGILTGKRKTHQVGKIVTSFAMGSQHLYELIDGNPLFSFQPIDAVCNAWTIGQQHKMVSVTQAYAVDLSGQVCSDQFEGNFYGGLAAQTEFLQGASRSKGGKAIICLASTDADGQTSRIRSVLQAGEGVAIPRSDVHFVVTEYGIAYLFGKSIRERAIDLIQIAHPDHRATLLEEAQALGYVPKEQQLRNLQAYAVDQENRVSLKNQQEVLLRPAGAPDGDAVRELFHDMAEQDVYTRFFRKIRSLSAADVQRLCNVNGETEVALVGVFGSREQPQVVAHAMYVLDPSTNLAETAFIVHPQWQGTGLGSHLQQQLIRHAKAAGVRGFIADMLPTNENMIRLAKRSAVQVSTEHIDGTVRVTAIF